MQERGLMNGRSAKAVVLYEGEEESKKGQSGGGMGWQQVPEGQMWVVCDFERKYFPESTEYNNHSKFEPELQAQTSQFAVGAKK
jgi:hypothetical protein